jgi:hypothetical protein
MRALAVALMYLVGLVAGAQAALFVVGRAVGAASAPFHLRLVPGRTTVAMLDRDERLPPHVRLRGPDPGSDYLVLGPGDLNLSQLQSRLQADGPAGREEIDLHEADVLEFDAASGVLKRAFRRRQAPPAP